MSSQRSFFSLQRGSLTACGRTAKSMPNSVPGKRDWNYLRKWPLRPARGDFGTVRQGVSSMDITTIIVGACSALAIAHMLTYGRRGKRWGRI